jgi:hypothetical protein
MQFTPCNDACTKEGTHCEGCGRSHADIAATKAIVKSAVDFIQQQQYDNPAEFVSAIGKSILKKLQKAD